MKVNSFSLRYFYCLKDEPWRELWEIELATPPYVPRPTEFIRIRAPSLMQRHSTRDLPRTGESTEFCGHVKEVVVIHYDSVQVIEVYLEPRLIPA